jgi:hypothetical protein
MDRVVVVVVVVVVSTTRVGARAPLRGLHVVVVVVVVAFDVRQFCLGCAVCARARACAGKQHDVRDVRALRRGERCSFFLVPPR